MLIDAFAKIDATPPLRELPAVVLSADKPWQPPSASKESDPAAGVTFADWRSVGEAACNVAQCQARRNDKQRTQRLCLCAAACHRRDPGSCRIRAGWRGDTMIFCRHVLTGARCSVGKRHPPASGAGCGAFRDRRSHDESHRGDDPEGGSLCHERDGGLRRPRSRHWNRRWRQAGLRQGLWRTQQERWSAGRCAHDLPDRLEHEGVSRNEHRHHGRSRQAQMGRPCRRPLPGFPDEGPLGHA